VAYGGSCVLVEREGMNARTITKTPRKSSFPSFVGQCLLNNKETMKRDDAFIVVSDSDDNAKSSKPLRNNEPTPAVPAVPTTGRENITNKGLNRMTFEQYTLPTHWATALMYGDEDSLTDEDLEHLNAFVDAQPFTMFHCVDVEDNESGDFRRYHDATAFGVLACDVSTFTFDVGVV
jgi:hypothetical protein